MLSYNDCSTIRDWYQDYDIVEVSWQYSLGQGETRIGKNRLERIESTPQDQPGHKASHVKPSHELLIVKH